MLVAMFTFALTPVQGHIPDSPDIDIGITVTDSDQEIQIINQAGETVNLVIENRVPLETSCTEYKQVSGTISWTHVIYVNTNSSTGEWTSGNTDTSYLLYKHPDIPLEAFDQLLNSSAGGLPYRC